MVKTEELGPDNPRDWNPNHPMLKSTGAPHETGGVLRMHRAGKTGAELMKLLRLRGTKLMNQMQKALDDEAEAHCAGRPIHDALINIPKEKS